MIGREHVGCRAGKSENLAAVGPCDSRGGISDFRHTARAGSTANINARAKVVVADLRRLADHGNLRTVRRPREINDGLEFRAPPVALRSAHWRHVNARDIVLYNVMHLCQRILRTRIPQYRESLPIRRDDRAANAVGHREDLSGFSRGKRHDGQLPLLLNFVDTEECGAVLYESGRLEMFGKLQLAAG